MRARNSRRSAIGRRPQSESGPGAANPAGQRRKASRFDRIEFVLVAVSIVLILGSTIVGIAWHLFF